MRVIGKNKLTLFVKMFILLFLSVSVTVTILGMWSFNRSSVQIEQATSSLLEENLQHNNIRIGQWFRRVELHTDWIIATEKLEVLDSKLGDQLFLSRALTLINDLKGSYELTIYPADVSRYETYSSFLRLGSGAAGSEWLRKAIELGGKGYWYFENDTFIFARTIRSTSDLRHLAVIQLSIPSSQIGQLIQPPTQYPTVRHLMMDTESEAVIWASKERNPDDKRHELLTTRPLAELPWQLVASIPEQDLIGPVQAIKRFSLLLVLVSIALITMLLGLITNSFVSPIQYIVNQMKRVQMGLLVPSERYVERSDEIGQLARGYNSLITGLQELLDTTKRMESDKSRMEMQMLIHQINPHFLYNTLDAVKWRADYVKETTISQMIASLSNLIRYSINNGEEFTTVEREIEHAKSYLSIESLRSPDSFQVVVSVHPKVLNMPILKLIIQPLVENSVRHGISKLPKGQGKILVRVYMEGEDLVCTVEDNGSGCPEEVQARINQMEVSQEPFGGVGLFNVNRRLKIRFGASYGVSLANSPSGGCKATIRHPLSAAGQSEHAKK